MQLSDSSIPHILAEDREGRRSIGIDIVLHGGDKNLVHRRIGPEALDSLEKVAQSIFHLMVKAPRIIDGVVGPLGCRTDGLHKAESCFWVQHGKCKVERVRRSVLCVLIKGNPSCSPAAPLESWSYQSNVGGGIYSHKRLLCRWSRPQFKTDQTRNQTQQQSPPPFNLLPISTSTGLHLLILHTHIFPRSSPLTAMCRCPTQGPSQRNLSRSQFTQPQTSQNAETSRTHWQGALAKVIGFIEAECGMGTSAEKARSRECGD